MDHRTDEELLSLLPTQQEAFSEFYRRHAQRVLGFAARRLDDPEEVADAVAIRDFGTRERVTIPTKNVGQLRIPQRLGPRAG